MDSEHSLGHAGRLPGWLIGWLASWLAAGGWQPLQRNEVRPLVHKSLSQKFYFPKCPH